LTNFNVVNSIGLESFVLSAGSIFLIDDLYPYVSPCQTRNKFAEICCASDTGLSKQEANDEEQDSCRVSK